MGRHTSKSTKAKTGDKKQLNALLPVQLVLDFNDEARSQGRDELLKNILLGYLEKVRPDATSVREHQALRRARLAEPPPDDTQMMKRELTQVREVLAETEALELARQSAAAIVAITRAVLRKGPKRSVATAVKRYRRASSL